MNNVSPAVKQLKHHAPPPAFIGITKKYVARTIKAVAALEPFFSLSASVIRWARSIYALGMWISIYFILAIQMSGTLLLAVARATACACFLFIFSHSPARPLSARARGGCKYIWVQIESASAKV